MVREEILGREPDVVSKIGKKGCAYLGKVVSYPAGRYEEVGTTFMDIVCPHCMLIVGKRGTGKSYTMGVLAEEFCRLEPQYRDRISVIIIDSMSVFHSLKTPNTIPEEVNRMKDFGIQAPQGFPDLVKIFMPQIAVKRFLSEGNRVSFDFALQMPLHEVEVFDWLTLFSIKPTEPAGVLLVKVMTELHGSGKRFDFPDIFEAIGQVPGSTDETRESLRGLFRMVEDTGMFHKVGTPYGAMVRGGQVSVLDVSYLGRLGAFDMRSLVVSLIARRLLRERTLYTTLEMQADAGLIDMTIGGKITQSHPLIYMMIDEAHLFLPSVGETFATEPLLDWIKVGRHPGLSLVFATQEPSALHESAIRQSDLIIAHNVTSSQDVDALGAAKQSFMSPSTDITTIVTTMEPKRGLSVIFDDKTRKIQMCRVRPRLSLHTGVDATAIPPEELGRNVAQQKAAQAARAQAHHGAEQRVEGPQNNQKRYFSKY